MTTREKGRFAKVFAERVVNELDLYGLNDAAHKEEHCFSFFSATLAPINTAYAQLGGFACPLAGSPMIRQGDKVASSGGDSIAAEARTKSMKL